MEAKKRTAVQGHLAMRHDIDFDSSLTSLIVALATEH